MQTLSRSLLHLEQLSNLLDYLKESCSTLEEEAVVHYFKFYKWCSALTSSLAITSLEESLSSSVLKLLLPQITTWGSFPYQEGNIGNWFQEQVPLKGVNRPINILNLKKKPEPNEKNYPPMNGTDFLSNLEEDGYQILFHGTTHESAKNIIENGISLDCLNELVTQDFSCGRGFYLTSTFEGDNGGAVTWAFRNFDNSRSVLIFKILCSTIDEFRENSKSFLNDDKGLKEFVKKCRFVDETKRRDLVKELKGTTFVEGPWVKLTKGRYISPIIGSYQICLHSKALAERFDQCVHSVIFFN